MIVCRECQHEEYDGALFCSECGASMLELGGDVAVLEAPRAPKPPDLLGQRVGTAKLPDEIVLMIPLTGRQLRFPIFGREIRIGRGGKEQADPPEFDTTPENGAEHGVSRNHAVIKSTENGVVIIDLNSTNGTLLNNFRLPPELPYPVKNGDELQFGSLLVHVFLM